MKKKTYIGIEAGGTKLVCAHGKNPQALQERVRIETRTPVETMAEVFDYIESVRQNFEVEAIGVASFGPLDLDRRSENYGSITSTPKKEWSNYNIINTLSGPFSMPIGFDTDVNAAALGEQRWGAGVDVDSLLYITVGTGIGVGVIVDNQLLHGAMHPEAGHICIPRIAGDDFQGICPYHSDCLEGLASGPAIKARWQVASALELSVDHQAWDIEAQYLAYAVSNYILCYAPQRVILGGGVMSQPGLLERIWPRIVECINGYVRHAYVDHIESYVVAAGLGKNAGIAGALALAEREHARR